MNPALLSTLGRLAHDLAFSGTDGILEDEEVTIANIAEREWLLHAARAALTMEARGMPTLEADLVVLTRGLELCIRRDEECLADDRRDLAAGDGHDELPELIARDEAHVEAMRELLGRVEAEIAELPGEHGECQMCGEVGRVNIALALDYCLSCEDTHARVRGATADLVLDLIGDVLERGEVAASDVAALAATHDDDFPLPRQALTRAEAIIYVERCARRGADVPAAVTELAR